MIYGLEFRRIDKEFDNDHWCYNWQHLNNEEGDIKDYRDYFLTSDINKAYRVLEFRILSHHENYDYRVKEKQ